MTHLRGMVVDLKTSSQSGAGTDAHIYIGVVGTRGGREFPLDVEGFNDFEPGPDVKYWLGTVWDGTAITGSRKPRGSEPGGNNNPQRYRIELDDVPFVYIRKAAGLTEGSDDAYRLDEVEVMLYGYNPESRSFGTTRDMWLSIENGLQLWLPED